MDSGQSSSMQSSGSPDDDFDSGRTAYPIPRPPSAFFHHHTATAPPPPQPGLFQHGDDNMLQPHDQYSYPHIPPPSSFHPSPNLSRSDHLWSTPAVGRAADDQSNVAQPRLMIMKKRTRASRKAPTTVVSVDAGNFRSMVQQYTGMPPTSPEAAGSSSTTARLNIISSAASGSSSSVSNIISASSSSCSNTTNWNSSHDHRIEHLSRGGGGSGSSNSNNNININHDHLIFNAFANQMINNFPAANFDTHPARLTSFQSLLSTSSQFQYLPPSTATATALGGVEFNNIDPCVDGNIGGFPWTIGLGSGTQGAEIRSRNGHNHRWQGGDYVNKQ